MERSIMSFLKDISGTFFFFSNNRCNTFREKSGEFLKRRRLIIVNYRYKYIEIFNTTNLFNFV